MLAKAVGQPTHMPLIDRIREQARSHLLIAFLLVHRGVFALCSAAFGLGLQRLLTLLQSLQ